MWTSKLSRLKRFFFQLLHQGPAINLAIGRYGEALNAPHMAGYGIAGSRLASSSRICWPSRSTPQ